MAPLTTVNPVEADTFNAPLCPHKLAWRSDAVWDELGPLMILGHNVTVGWSEPVHVCAQLNHSFQLFVVIFENHNVIFIRHLYLLSFNCPFHYVHLKVLVIENRVGSESNDKLLLCVCWFDILSTCHNL